MNKRKRYSILFCEYFVRTNALQHKLHNNKQMRAHKMLRTPLLQQSSQQLIFRECLLWR